MNRIPFSSDLAHILTVKSFSFWIYGRFKPVPSTWPFEGFAAAGGTAAAAGGCATAAGGCATAAGGCVDNTRPVAGASKTRAQPRSGGAWG